MYDSVQTVPYNMNILQIAGDILKEKMRCLIR